ncbi:hypothetical protein M404DRAFT_344461 [Pisolithus tinctorius Marx 270]|uniref:Uncharacterized protein n=1 Tax=Pisolithus tinctorius Marx 270 TaxID=870435 RepID=A0A0C3KFB4_PISTI|nr:hypothetical protein M404DRAFT_344461 [Pisolithus tinctorius Marx 270]
MTLLAWLGLRAFVEPRDQPSCIAFTVTEDICQVFRYWLPLSASAQTAKALLVSVGRKTLDVVSPYLEWKTGRAGGPFPAIIFPLRSFIDKFPQVWHDSLDMAYLAQGVAVHVVNSEISIPLGIFIGLMASFIQSVGLAVQRRSHVLNSQLSESERKAEYRRPLWLLGFVVFITSNILGSLVQIASLPVVILAPLGAVSLLWNALFARLLLRPPLILGTALIGGGAALIAVYGIMPETTRGLDELIALFVRPAFLVWFCVEAALVVVCLIVTHVAEYSFARRVEVRPYAFFQSDDLDQPLPGSASLASPSLSSLGDLPTRQVFSCIEESGAIHHTDERTPLLYFKGNGARSTSPCSRCSSSQTRDSAITTPVPSLPIANRTALLLALAYAATSGIMSGLCLIFAKSGVELLLLTLGGSNQFYRWEAWALVGGLVVFAIGQLWYLNQALRLADPAFVCPSAFCFYNFSSILNGLVYFDQLRHLPGQNIVLVVIGMIILLGGVWTISGEAGVEHVWLDQPDEEVSEAEAPTSSVDEVDTVEYPRGKQSCSDGRLTAVPMERNAYSEGALDGAATVWDMPSPREVSLLSGPSHALGGSLTERRRGQDLRIDNPQQRWRLSV